MLRSCMQRFSAFNKLRLAFCSLRIAVPERVASCLLPAKHDHLGDLPTRNCSRSRKSLESHDAGSDPLLDLQHSPDL